MGAAETEKFFKDTDKYIADNAVGGAVVFIKGFSIKRISKIPIRKELKLSYHLHYFFYENRERKELVVQCLDTGFFGKITGFPGDYLQFQIEIEKTINSINSQFLDMVTHISVKKPDISPVDFFNKCGTEYWDIFNRMKEEYFCWTIKDITNSKLKTYKKGKIAYPKSIYESTIEDLFFDKKMPAFS